MDTRSLPPEARIALRMRLDALRHAGERCYEALEAFADGRLRRDDLVASVRHQQDAQRSWEESQRKYLVKSGVD